MLISLIFFIVLGKYILQLWGNEFTEAYIVLIILSFGQLFNIGTGGVAQLLIMTGLHKLHTYITVGFMFLYVILNYVLISYWGMIGAAIANAFTFIAMNIFRIVIVKRKLGILTLPFK